MYGSSGMNSGMIDPRMEGRTRNGWVLFASVLIFLAGAHNLIYGIAALRDFGVIVRYTDNGATLLYADTTFWGWLWVAIGIVLLVVSAGVYVGNRWARWGAIGLLVLNAIGQLAFLSAFPTWSVIIIALDVLAIYALTTTADAATPSSFEPYPDDRSQLGQGLGASERKVQAGVGGRDQYGAGAADRGFGDAGPTATRGGPMPDSGPGSTPGTGGGSMQGDRDRTGRRPGDTLPPPER
jgi:hypothetical protein